MIVSFDRQFAYSLGIPVRLLDAVFKFSCHSNCHIVGRGSCSGISNVNYPSPNSYLLVDRMYKMIFLAIITGVISAILGVFFSFLGSNLPTGPFMVISSSLLFAMAYLFSPKNGRITNWYRYLQLKSKVRKENTLKMIYHYLEKNAEAKEGVNIEVSELLRTSKGDTKGKLSSLRIRKIQVLNWKIKN